MPDLRPISDDIVGSRNVTDSHPTLPSAIAMGTGCIRKVGCRRSRRIVGMEEDGKQPDL